MEHKKIDYQDFERVRMLSGTITDAVPFPEARKPSFRLTIDLGQEGLVQSSAQITDHYVVADLIGTQVIVVANFPPKRIAGFKSECLVLGVSHESGGVVLLRPDKPVPNGSRVY
jgi:tRNA-binding protein